MKIKYVQLEGDAFLTDLDYITMSHAERSAYCTLIFYLNSNNGKCEYKPSALSKLCHCENVEEFEEIWQGISKKFQVRSNIIKHKRVTKELRRAKQYRQAKSRAGLKGAEKRWHSHSTDVAKETKRNEKEKKNNSNTYSSEQSVSFSSSARPHLQALNFNSALINIIKPRSQSDRTCFRNITSWLMSGCATGRFNEKIFDRVLDYAREASTGRNPAAVFMALIKKELGYRTARMK
jgi:uncharacterized protein YdaU (DUF1376 family)